MAKFDRDAPFADQQNKPRFDRDQPFVDTSKKKSPADSRDNASLSGAARNLGEAVLMTGKGLIVDPLMSAAEATLGLGANLVDRGLEAAGVDIRATDRAITEKTGIKRGPVQVGRDIGRNMEATTQGSQAGKIGNITGNIMATLPLGGVNVAGGTGMIPRFVNGAVQGSLGGGMIAASRPEESAAMQVGGGGLAGGVTNAALPPLIKAGAKVLSPVMPPIMSLLRPGAAKAAVPSTTEALPYAKAAAERAGLTWDNLDDGLRARMTDEIAKARQVGADVPLEAVARKVVYEGLGLIPTRGMATRNWDDAWTEQNLLTEPEGEPLRQLYQRNNDVIRQNLRGLAPEGVQPLEAPAFGAALRKPIVEGERRAQGVANKAWRTADAAEGQTELAAAPLLNYWRGNAESLAVTDAGKKVIEHMRTIGVLEKGGLNPRVNKEFSYASGPQYRPEPLTLRQLQSLRQIVNDEWKSATGSTRAQLNQMREVLNQMEEGAGGELFKAYRQIRAEKGNRFENNPVIDKLLADKKGYYGTDLIEDSEVFDKVILRQPPEQLAKLMARLTPKARDLTRAQMAKHLEDAAFGNQARNEAGDVVASAAKLDRALKDIGMPKLRMIFGGEKAEKIQLLSKSLGEISNPPKGTVPQGSAPKLAFLSRALLGTLNLGGRLPSVAGDAMAGAASVIKRGSESRQNQIQVRNAVDLMGPYIEESANQMIQRATRGAAPGASVIGADTARERVKQR